MEHLQCIVAVFDDWAALQSVLADLTPDRVGPTSAILFARDGEPLIDPVPALLQELAELNFAASAISVRCTAGRLATDLQARSDGGAESIAVAVRGWLGDGLARELQRHINHGRLVLWLEPTTQDDCDAACAQLARASPHLVGVSEISRQP